MFLQAKMRERDEMKCEHSRAQARVSDNRYRRPAASAGVIARLALARRRRGARRASAPKRNAPRLAGAKQSAPVMARHFTAGAFTQPCRHVCCAVQRFV